jgi:predicted TIM-barrel fold metal-dependent hydrolase
MRATRVFALGVTIAAVGLGGVGASQSQSAGSVTTRPGSDRTPEFPPPSIRDYKPRSTLVVPVHTVPRARYPVIDIHSHQPAPITREQLKTVAGSMEALNIRVLVNTGDPGSGTPITDECKRTVASGEQLARSVAAIRETPYADRMLMFANIAFCDVGPGFGARAAGQLERDVKAGATGLGELSKSLGLGVLKADGSRLRIDDPELDPIWETAARLRIPVLIHTGDPQEFFQPLDLRNERWLELALYPERRVSGPGYPTFEELIAERDRLFRRHPKTVFILAHMGWQANDLARLGRLLDEMPNIYPEVGAVLHELGRQPRAARAFIVKYQDRVLFGKDSYQPDEFPYYWRVFETKDEYFDYYREYHAFWKLYGIDLPDAVLKKVYYQNALRITPKLPQTGWPK